ncbi:FAD-dependent monooxygenase [Streptomyces sp. MST-110588]|uniref:FAD-dependent oxidoreductase n=1 Tax=Streptomyces sp. MST-110588 TaxID=2833628 RepID=UPI001F5C72E1|nr:FAD-dependent monooxygenase [Streptomyces sp. MST-110588]UNO43592.1 FAD-dependent monooxygenase [Streptomyces sp. MST-110588]
MFSRVRRLATTVLLAGNRLIVQWLASSQEVAQLRATDVAWLRSRISAVRPELANALAASVPDWGRARIVRHHVVQPHHWGRGNAGLGDAAHGSHSIAGQGLSTALQGAAILARSLTQAQGTARAAPFAPYEQMRKPFTEHFQRYRMSLPQLTSQHTAGAGPTVLYASSRMA